MNRDFDGLITFSSAKNAAFSILPFTREIVKVPGVVLASLSRY